MPDRRRLCAAWLPLVLALTVLLCALPAVAAPPLEGKRAKYSVKLVISLASDQRVMGAFPVTGAFTVDFRKRNWFGSRKVEVVLDQLRLPEPVAGAQAEIDKVLGKKLTFRFDKRDRLVNLYLPGLPLGKMRKEQGQLPSPKAQELEQTLKAMPPGTTVSIRTSIPKGEGGEALVFGVDLEYAGLSEDGQDYVLRLKANGNSRALPTRGVASLGASGDISLTGTLQVNAASGLVSGFDLEALLSQAEAVPGTPSHFGFNLSIKLESLAPL